MGDVFGSIILIMSLLSGFAVMLKPMSTRSEYFQLRSESFLTAAFFVRIRTIRPGCERIDSRHCGRQSAFPLAPRSLLPPCVQSSILVCWLGFDQTGLASLPTSAFVAHLQPKDAISVIYTIFTNS
jgi:hypothetical protein